MKTRHEGLDQGTKRQKDGPRMTSTWRGDKQEHVQDGDESIDQSQGQIWTKSRRGTHLLDCWVEDIEDTRQHWRGCVPGTWP
jgi:hypothetical protein